MKSLLLILALCGLTACSTLDKIDTESATVRASVRIFTINQVEDDGGINQAKAARVHSVASGLLDFIDGSDTVTISGLESFLISQIDWGSKTPTETAAYHEFIALLADYLAKREPSSRVVVARDLIDIVVSTLDPVI